MVYVTSYDCTICGEKWSPINTRLTCPNCGVEGILDIQFDYDAIKKVFTKDNLIHNLNHTITRYQPLMGIELLHDEILGVGWTPLYRHTTIGNELGLHRLFLKDETVQPTSSLKDRASLVACMDAKNKGYSTICCSSTGNAASSLAGHAAKLGLHTVIVVPERAPIGKLTQLIMYGAKVIKIKGDYEAAFSVSQDLIKRYRMYSRNAAINPHLVEGKKTVALELIEQLDFNAPDYIIVSVGDGCTIGGVYKGCYDMYQLGLIDHIPHIIGVQAEGCAPFVTAFQSGRPVTQTHESTFADSIAVGLPRNPIKGMQAVTKSGGTFVTVTDDEIKDAMIHLASKEGIFAEPAGATALAGLYKIQHTKPLDQDASVVVLITGNGLKDPNSVNQIVLENVLTVTKDDAIKLSEETESIAHFLTQLQERSEQHE